MAAIKVQSIGDIITAYLETLGMSRDDDRLEFFVKELHASLGDLTGKEKDIVSLLDGVLCQKAQKYLMTCRQLRHRLRRYTSFVFWKAAVLNFGGKNFCIPKIPKHSKKRCGRKTLSPRPGMFYPGCRRRK